MDAAIEHVVEEPPVALVIRGLRVVEAWDAEGRDSRPGAPLASSGSAWPW